MIAATPPPDANGVRMSAADLIAAKRTVIVHLTSYAEGCTTASISDARRNRTFWNWTIDRVLRATLTRIKRAPTTVRAAIDAFDDPVLIGATDPFGDVPLVAFWEGLDARELQDALAILARGGWRPVADAPPPLRSLEPMQHLFERPRR